MATVQCECGEAFGEMCAWSGPESKTVIVEWMPEYLRGSHTAAGNRGVYPHNGSVRFRAEKSCAESLMKHDGEWTEIIGTGKRRTGLADRFTLRGEG